MKLDASALRYLTDDDFRVLTAVEMGMRNHELVPIALVSAISGLKHGGAAKSLKVAHKHKLVHRESKRYVGYRLTSLGYDYLALRALVKRGVLSAVGRPLGVGKEADVVLATPSEELLEEHPDIADELSSAFANDDGGGAASDDGEERAGEIMVAMKIHRLGRTSFRAVKQKRDYMAHRKSASWIYLSRLAAVKEYAFMCALHERKFPVPRPLGHSRHVVIMQLVDGVPLNQVAELDDAPQVAQTIVGVIARLARHGLVHCDLNEFNIMIGQDERVTVIDFPQMVSTRHPDAKEFYDRDVDGVYRFFSHRFGMDPALVDRIPFEDAAADTVEDGESERIDLLLSASGFQKYGDDGVKGMDMETLALPSEETLREELVEQGETSSAEWGTGGMNGTGESDTVACAEEGRESATPVSGTPGHPVDPVGKVGSRDSDELQSEPNENLEDDVSSVCCGSEYSVGGTRLDHRKISERVRRQRSNQARRRQMNTRNMVKDSEKRKAKVEIDGSSLWG